LDERRKKQNRKKHQHFTDNNIRPCKKPKIFTQAYIIVWSLKKTAALPRGGLSKKKNYHFTQGLSGKTLREYVLNSFQSGGQ
jgi:hypothetical protein